MLQSIQYIGSGPPTYVYSENATSASNMFYQVFATQTNGYDAQHEDGRRKEPLVHREEHTASDAEVVDAEFRVLEVKPKENLEEVYKKQYGKREAFLWKQK